MNLGHRRLVHEELDGASNSPPLDVFGGDAADFLCIVRVHWGGKNLDDNREMKRWPHRARRRGALVTRSAKLLFGCDCGGEVSMTFDPRTCKARAKIRNKLRPLSEQHRVLMDTLLFGDYSHADEVARVQEQISEMLERIKRMGSAKECGR